MRDTSGYFSKRCCRCVGRRPGVVPHGRSGLDRPGARRFPCLHAGHPEGAHRLALRSFRSLNAITAGLYRKGGWPHLRSTGQQDGRDNAKSATVGLLQLSRQQVRQDRAHCHSHRCRPGPCRPSRAGQHRPPAGYRRNLADGWLRPCLNHPQRSVPGIPDHRRQLSQGRFRAADRPWHLHHARRHCPHGACQRRPRPRVPASGRLRRRLEPAPDPGVTRRLHASCFQGSARCL